MTINPQRILANLEAIAAFTECPAAVGHNRPTFSQPWAKSRDYVIDQARRAGCKSKIDAAGNVHIRPEAISWDAKVWLSGSHIDSVPTGGKYDGVVGIVCPLEVLRAAREAGRNDLPLELIIFAEEEGTTFGLGMIGSRLWTGAATPSSVAKFKNRDGHDFIEAGKPFGVQPDRLDADRLNPNQYLGLIEIHVEQGPAMWEENIPAAVVTAIAGRKQFKVTIRGEPNHAGSTPMNYRADALVAAAKVIVGVEQLAKQLRGTVATVGRIECEPNAINVIPGTVKFTVDLRSPEEALLKAGHEKLEALVKACGRESEFVVTENQAVMKMDVGVCEKLATAMGNSPKLTSSGALHDAAILAPVIPTAMLFVASKGGISHNPAEFSRIEDIAEAARVLARVLV